jgi:DNA-binding CsgD family transcriptional regulator
LTLRGSSLESEGGDADVVVTIELARGADMNRLTLMARGLTMREQEVVGLLLKGASTKTISASLFLSPHTVQDHLKAVFTKTGVNSRSELVGQIFLEHYAPRWEDITGVPAGWTAKASPAPAGAA